ncbi:MAG: hypothetical protein C4313_03050 [Thermoflexus sp.]|uniref:hypothetical protein n=1 Tax=Thermoflexus sp. TaxID=1969742 RepID=UPI0033303E65
MNRQDGSLGPLIPRHAVRALEGICTPSPFLESTLWTGATLWMRRLDRRAGLEAGEMLAIGLLGTLYFQVDSLLLAYLRGLKEVGRYRPRGAPPQDPAERCLSR